MEKRTNQKATKAKKPTTEVDVPLFDSVASESDMPPETYTCSTTLGGCSC